MYEIYSGEIKGMKHLLASTVIASGLLAFVPASNAALILSGGTTVPMPIIGNDFDSDLDALGYTDMTTDAQLSVDQDGFVTFTYIGAESGFTNSFNTSSGSMSEANEAFNFSGYSSLTINVSAGDTLDFSFTSSDVNALSPVNNLAGTNLEGLGIFTAGSSLQQVVLGYDDQNFNDDDNHDDMLIRVDFSPVPVPAAVWLFGSGLIGLFGLARRKQSV